MAGYLCQFCSSDDYDIHDEGCPNWKPALLDQCQDRPGNLLRQMAAASKRVDQMPPWLSRKGQPMTTTDQLLDEREKTNQDLLKDDIVNHPKHYTSHPSGIECIQVTEWMNFNLGNAIKYIWRLKDKEDQITNLRKAAWYIEREIVRLQQSPRP